MKIYTPKESDSYKSTFQYDKGTPQKSFEAAFNKPYFESFSLTIPIWDKGLPLIKRILRYFKINKRIKQLERDYGNSPNAKTITKDGYTTWEFNVPAEEVEG